MAGSGHAHAASGRSGRLWALGTRRRGSLRLHFLTVSASRLLGVEALWPGARTDSDDSGPGLEEQPGKQPAPRRSAGELGDMHVRLPALLGT